MVPRLKNVLRFPTKSVKPDCRRAGHEFHYFPHGGFVFSLQRQQQAAWLSALANSSCSRCAIASFLKFGIFSGLMALQVSYEVGCSECFLHGLVQRHTISNCKLPIIFFHCIKLPTLTTCCQIAVAPGV